MKCLPTLRPFIGLALICFCSQLDSAAAASNSNPLPGSRIVGLSPFWDRELVAADLALEELSLIENLKKVRVGVIDSPASPKEFSGKMSVDFNAHGSQPDHSRHGVQVTNLITAPWPAGLAPTSELSDFANAVNLRKETASQTESDVLNAALQFSRRSPDIVNISQHLGDDPITAQAYEAISKHSLLVVIAGNNERYGINRNNRTIRGILVGSINPAGLMSGFSSDGKELTFFAPADELQLSYDSNGTHGEDYYPFGGTSGAAPLVTAALANAWAVLGSLDLEEAKTLLTRTGLPILSQRNGILINSYKLVKAARRLKERGWPENREKLLLTSDIYDFCAEASALEHASSDATTAFEKLKIERKSFFLCPTVSRSEKVSRSLIATGTPLNAHFFEGFGDSARLRTVVLAAVKSEIKGYAPAAARTIPFLSEKLDIMKALLSKTVPSLILEEGSDSGMQLRETATELSETDVGLCNILSAVEEEVIKYSKVPCLARYNPSALLKLVNDPDEKVRQAIAEFIPASVGCPEILNHLSNDVSEWVRITAVERKRETCSSTL